MGKIKNCDLEFVCVLELVFWYNELRTKSDEGVGSLFKVHSLLNSIAGDSFLVLRFKACKSRIGVGGVTRLANCHSLRMFHYHVTRSL